MTRHRRRGHALAGALVSVLFALTSVFTDARPAAAAETPAPASCAATDQAAAASMVPDDCWGNVPSSHFDIGCDEGAWNDVGRKVYCLFTDMAFQTSRALTSTSLWLVGWGFGLNLNERLGSLAVDVADRLEHNLVGPLDLLHFVWFYAIAWAALQATKGKLAFAGGELLISVVAAAGAAFVLANPAGYLTGAFETMEGTSAAVLSVATGEQVREGEPDSTRATVRPVQAAVHRAFVEDPYDHLNWGHPLTGACAEARDAFLAEGPHGNDDGPREDMRGAGCEAEAEFNHDPSGNRLFGAVLTLFAALSVVVLLALMAMTLVVAQVFVIILFALAPLSLLGGILPGSGRELLWRWLAALLRSVLAVVGMSFVLALLLTTVTALLQGTETMGLTERFALLNALVLAMFVARKRIVAAGAGLAGAMGQRLATRRAGGGREAAWMTTPAVAGATGFALASAFGPDRASRSSRLAGTIGRDRMADRRMKRHSDRAVNRVQARERSEIRVGEGGMAERRSVVTVDGPVARSGRARRTRTRVETRAARSHGRSERARHGGGAWASAPAAIDDDMVMDDPAAAVFDGEDA